MRRLNLGIDAMTASTYLLADFEFPTFWIALLLFMDSSLKTKLFSVFFCRVWKQMSLSIVWMDVVGRPVVERWWLVAAALCATHNEWYTTDVILNCRTGLSRRTLNVKLSPIHGRTKMNYCILLLLLRRIQQKLLSAFLYFTTFFFLLISHSNG